MADDSPARAVRIRWTPADFALAQQWAKELNLPDARGAAVQTALRAALPEADSAARADAVHDQRLEVYRAVADDLRARFRVPERAAEDAAWAMLQKGWLVGELPKKDPRGE